MTNCSKLLIFSCVTGSCFILLAGLVPLWTFQPNWSIETRVIVTPKEHKVVWWKWPLPHLTNTGHRLADVCVIHTHEPWCILRNICHLYKVVSVLSIKNDCFWVAFRTKHNVDGEYGSVCLCMGTILSSGFRLPARFLAVLPTTRRRSQYWLTLLFLGKLLGGKLEGGSCLVLRCAQESMEVIWFHENIADWQFVFSGRNGQAPYEAHIDDLCVYIRPWNGSRSKIFAGACFSVCYAWFHCRWRLQGTTRCCRMSSRLGTTRFDQPENRGQSFTLHFLHPYCNSRIEKFWCLLFRVSERSCFSLLPVIQISA